MRNTSTSTTTTTKGTRTRKGSIKEQNSQPVESVNKSQSDTDRLYTLDQVSEILGDRSKVSIYRDIEAGRLPKIIKIGRSSRIRHSELMAAIKNF